MDLYQELLSFRQALKDYKELLNQLHPLQPLPAAYQNKRESLLLDSSRLIPQIKRLTGRDESLVIYEFGKPRSINMWEMGLRNEYDYRTAEAIDACIDNTTIAIGKLEKEGASWGVLGDKRRTGKTITEAPEDYEEKAASKELELILEGTPDMIIECITNFVKKLNSQGYTYKSIPKIGGAPDFAKWDKTYSARCTILETREGSDEQIGAVRLTLLPKEQTLLSVPEPEDWKSSFGAFLSYLLGEFKRLGFVHFEEEKPPIGFRPSHKE